MDRLKSNVNRFLILLVFIFICQQNVMAGYDVDQNFLDSVGNVFDQDSTTYTLIENVVSDSFGIIFACHACSLDGQGYTVTFAGADTTAVNNSGFETQDAVNDSLPESWDFTNAPDFIRDTGWYLVNGTNFWRIPPTLWAGDYSLQARTPLSQKNTIVSDDSYTFTAGMSYAVSTMAYNKIYYGDSIELRIGLLDGTDTAYVDSRMGKFMRGFVPLDLQFTAPDSGDVTYKIFLEADYATMADSVYVGGNWYLPVTYDMEDTLDYGYLCFDDVLIQFNNIHGLVIGTDATEQNYHYPMMENWYGVSEVYIDDVVVEPATNLLYDCRGVYMPYTVSGTQIHNSNITIRGALGKNIYSRNARDETYTNDSLFNLCTVGGERDYMTVCYMDLTGSGVGGGYNDSLDNIYCYGSIHAGILFGMAGDTSLPADHDVHVIRNSTIYLSSKYINGFALYTYGGAYRADNVRIYANSDSTYGRGIYLLNGATTVYESEIKNCFVHTWQKDTIQEYEYVSSSYGIQLEEANNVTIEACSVIVRTDNERYNKEGGLDHRAGRALRIGGTATPSSNVVIKDSYFGGFAEGHDWAIAVNFNNANYEGLTFENNTISTNDTWLEGIFETDSVRFYNCIWEIDTSTGTLKTSGGKFSALHAPHAYGSNNYFRHINNIFADEYAQSLYDSSYFRGSSSSKWYTSAGYATGWYVGYEDSIYIKNGGSGDPIENAELLIYYGDDDTLFIDTTDATGCFVVDLWKFRDSATTTAYNRNVHRTYYEDYVIRAEKGSDVDSVIRSSIDSAEVIDLEFGTSSEKVFVLTSDSLPWTSHANYDTVRIAGTSITANDTGIIINHDGVYLDFGIDTLLFGSNGADDPVGVLFNWGSDQGHIRGGFILHDIDDTAGADDAIGVKIFGVNGFVLDTTTVVVRGVNSNCVDNHSGKCINVIINGGYYDNRCHGYTSRCYGQYGSAIYIQADSMAHGSDVNLEVNCATVRSPHSCIWAERGSGATEECLLMVYNCSLFVDANNDLYDSTNGTSCHSAGDPFAIQVYGIKAGSEIHDNIIIAGDDHYGGDGIMIQEAQGIVSDSIKVYNNTMLLHHGRHPALPAGLQHCVGIYFRNPEPISHPEDHSQYVWIANNSINILVDALGSTDHIGANGEGARFYLTDSLNHNVFENNFIEVIRADSLTPDSGDVATCGISICRADTVDMTETSYGSEYTDDNHFRYNHYRCYKSPYWLGGHRESGLCANYITTVGDTLNTIGDVSDSMVVLFNGNGTYQDHSIGNRIIDATLLGNANDTNIVWSGLTENVDTCLGKTVAFERILNWLYVKDIDGIPVESADIYIVNNYGDTVTTGATDANGKYSDTLVYAFHGYDPDPGDGCVIGDSLGYNDFIFIAKKNGDSTSTTVTVNAQWSGYDTLMLDDQSMTPIIKKLKTKKSRIQEYGLNENVEDIIFRFGYCCYINDDIICYRDQCSNR